MTLNWLITLEPLLYGHCFWQPQHSVTRSKNDHYLIPRAWYDQRGKNKFELQLFLSYFFTARQRSYGKVMFSVVSLILFRRSPLYRVRHPPPSDPSVGGAGDAGPPCTGPRPGPPSQGPGLKTCSNLINLNLNVQTFHPLHQHPLPSRHIQTCALWSTGCQNAAGWHSIEMPSCFHVCYRLVLTVSRLFTLILCPYFSFILQSTP